LPRAAADAQRPRRVALQSSRYQEESRLTCPSGAGNEPATTSLVLHRRRCKSLPAQPTTDGPHLSPLRRYNMLIGFSSQQVVQAVQERPASCSLWPWLVVGPEKSEVFGLVTCELVGQLATVVAILVDGGDPMRSPPRRESSSMARHDVVRQEIPFLFGWGIQRGGSSLPGSPN
jgi:hypothetical protein